MRRVSTIVVLILGLGYGREGDNLESWGWLQNFQIDGFPTTDMVLRSIGYSIAYDQVYSYA